MHEAYIILYNSKDTIGGLKQARCQMLLGLILISALRFILDAQFSAASANG